MSKVAIGLIVLALAGAAMCQEIPEGPINCDYRLRSEKCFTILPWCRTYTITKDPKNEGKTIFTCNSCDPGFEPIPGGVNNLQLIEFQNIPDVTPFAARAVFLCRRVESKDPLYCSHPACAKELGQCLKYTITNIIEEEIEDGSKIRAGDYTCLECNEMFEPRFKEAQQKLVLDPTIPKLLCKRKLGTGECGENCQDEMPGCSTYTISKPEIRSRDEFPEEFAQFYCNEAENGYESVMRLEKYNTDTAAVKEIAIREYESGDIDCLDLECRHVFPNCHTYVSISQDDDDNAYICRECRAGYKPLKYQVYGKDFHELYTNKQSVQLCELVNQKSVTPDDYWKEEMPGCTKFTITEAKYDEDGEQQAVYTCEQCAAGMEIIHDTNPVAVRKGWDLYDNVKARCRPIAKTNPTPCDEQCRLSLKFCQEYKTGYDADYSDFVERFECTKCDDGFIPTQSPDEEPWYFKTQKHVCKRVPVPEIDCPEICKETFPNCDRISISKDENGHNVYQCHQCSAGFYPIDYENGVKGRLSAQYNPMRSYNVIYLCSDNPDELYLSKTDCDTADDSIFDSKACHSTVNCDIVAEVRNLLTGKWYEKCLKCPEGYKVKNPRPAYYAYDQSLCEKIVNPQSSIPVWE